MRVAIVGAGYAGKVQAVRLCDLGHSVILIENDRDRYTRLAVQDFSGLKDPGVNEGLRRHRGSLLTVSDKLDDVGGCSIVFLCISTPARLDDFLDISPLEAMLQQIVNLLAQRTNLPAVPIVIKSNVPVGTCRRLRDRLLAVGAQSSTFAIIINPDFFSAGSDITDVNNPDRLVIGVDQEDCQSSQMLIELYRCNSNHIPVAVMSWESAELVKLASNAFLAAKVSFANMIADVCEQVGADSIDVLGAVGADRRIGAHFLKPGIGWGGVGLSNGLNTLIHELRLNKLSTTMLDAVRNINRERPRQFVLTMKAVLDGLRGRRIGIWGVSYKGGTDDARDSPAISVVNWLLSEGAVVRAYDEPMPSLIQTFNLELVSDPIGALREAEALCILNDNPQFAELLWSPACKEAMRSPVIFDGRNLYDPKEIGAFGYTYLSIGRRSSASSRPAQRVMDQTYSE